MVDFKFDLQLFGGITGGGGGKGGDSGSTTTSYEPSEEEKQIMKYMLQNATNAETGITSLLDQFNTGVQSDTFKNLLSNSSNLISSGQNTYSSLMNGELPSAYTQNMSDAIKTSVNNTVGSNINSLASRGVLNSSVTNKALNDIESNVSDTMAKSYLSNISTLGNLAGQQINSATAGYAPYSTLAQLGQGQTNTYINGPVSALRGSGTSTSSQSSGGSLGGSLLNAGLGLATGWAGKQMGLFF